MVDPRRCRCQCRCASLGRHPSPEGGPRAREGRRERMCWHGCGRPTALEFTGRLSGSAKYIYSLETRSQHSRSRDPFRLFISRCLALVGERTATVGTMTWNRSAKRPDFSESLLLNGVGATAVVVPPTGTTGSKYSLTISLSYLLGGI